jgi:hypothetical protein
MIPSSAVGSVCMTQPIDSPGKTGEDLVANKVAATSPVSPDKSDESQKTRSGIISDRVF